MALNLKPEMEQIGGYFQMQLRQYIQKQRDLWGNPFKPITPETAKSRQYANNRRVGSARERGVKGRIKYGRKVIPGAKFGGTPQNRAGGLSTKRLLFTGRFMHNAYQFQAWPDRVRVFVNDSYYTLENKRLVTYRNIVEWNNAGTSTIIGAPKIFPLTKAEILKMQTPIAKSVRLLRSPKVKQKIFGREYRKKIVVTLGI